MASQVRSIPAAAARALAWLGRQGPRAMALIVLIGIAVPPLGALLKPFVTEAIFVLLCIACMRVDLAALRGHMRRPRLILLATAWITLAVPALVGIICFAIGLDARSPDLLLAVMLQAVASPIMSSPAIAALLGLDSTLVLVGLVASSAAAPITAPLFAHVFVGPMLALSPLALGLKLFAIIGGAALVAAAIRKVVGAAAIARRAHELDGVNVIVLFVFVAAIMENVAASFIATPLLAAGLTVLAFAMFLLLFAATAAILSGAGWDRAIALGLAGSQRNLGLMLAAAGGALPDLVWLYFALAQLPIYLSPQLLAPLARRVRRRPRAGAPTAPYV